MGIRLFDPLYKIMEEHGVTALKLNKDHDSHNRWRDFDEKTFILCLVRNPQQRSISEFSHWANYGDDGQRTHRNGRDRDCPHYTKEKFIYWLENKHIENYQSGVIGDNLGRINKLMRVEGLRGNENDFRKRLLKELGISHEFSFYPPDYEGAFMPPEKRLNDLFNENPEFLSLLAEKNEKDAELYSQASMAF